MKKNNKNSSRLFKMNNKFDFSRSKLGIQIGDSILKIVLLEREKSGQWNVKEEITEKLADDLVSEGKILQPEILGFKIRETLINHNIKEKKVSVFIEELPFFVRQIRLPQLPKKEIKEAIQYKAQSELPVNVKELIIHFSHLNSQVIDGKVQEEYTVIAVYRSFIEKAIQSFKQAGLLIESFGLEPEALYKGLFHKGVLKEVDGPLLIIRKDSRRMMLSVYKQDKLMYSRYTPISSAYGREEDDEEEITRTILSWNGKYTKDRIKSVILLGEEEHWKNTEQGIKVFMPFLELQIITCPYAACLGIALNNGPEEAINLYPKEQIVQYRKNRFIIYPLFAFLAFLLLFFLSTEFQLRTDIETLHANIDNSQDLVDLLIQRKQLMNEKGNLELIKTNSEQSHLNGFVIINKIKSYLPNSVKLSEIGFSREQINLGGIGRTQEEVMTFYKKLQSDVEYHNVHLTQSSKSNEGVIFTIEFQLIPSLIEGK